MSQYTKEATRPCTIPAALQELLLPCESYFASRNGMTLDAYEALKQKVFVREEDAERHTLVFSYSCEQLKAALAAMRRLAQPLVKEIGEENSWPILLMETDTESEDKAPVPMLELSKRLEEENPVAGIVSLCYHNYTLQLFFSAQPVAGGLSFLRHFKRNQVSVIDCRGGGYETHVAYPVNRLPQQPVWNLKKGGRALFEKKKDVYDFAIQSAENQCGARRLLVLGSEIDEKILTAHGLGVHQRYESKEALVEELAKAPAYCILCQNPEEETAFQECGLEDYKDYFVISRSAEYVDRLLQRPLPPGAETATMHIMASSTAELMPTIFTQLEELYENMPQRDIKFYVFHSPQANAAFQELKLQAQVFPNIELISIVPRVEQYEKMRSLWSWAWWPNETAYWICAHLYLPEDLDRVLCVNAGDVMFDGDLAPFYFEDFEGKPLIVTMEQPFGYQSIDEEGRVHGFSRDDLWNASSQQREMILQGLYNSGSVLINLQYMREHRFTEDTYYEYAKKIHAAFPDVKIWLDQGIMSAYFGDRMKRYGLAAPFQDAWFRPYNFVLFFFDGDYTSSPYYRPRIVHFAGFHTVKPWLSEYAVTFHPGAGEPTAMAGDYPEAKRVYYEKWFGYYIRGQLRLDARSYLTRCQARHVDELNLRNRQFLALVEQEIQKAAALSLPVVKGGFWLTIPLSEDGALHYEILCKWGPPAVCLHFEGAWYQRAEKGVVSQQAVARDREDPLGIALISDHVGCFYQLPAYDERLAVLYLRRLIRITLPLLRRAGILDDAHYLMLQ